MKRHLLPLSFCIASIWWAGPGQTAVAQIGEGDLVISEFRVRGPSGANDEFIEIYNTTDSPITVASTDATAGFGVASSDGVSRFTIPNGTVIPAHGHYLGVNSVAYSLASYPAGNGTTATGDATYVTDIPDNAGIALFSSSTSFILANRLDAVGSTSEANTLYKEGTGYPALTPFSIDYSFHRIHQQTGDISPDDTDFAPATDGEPKDTDNNSVDFGFVDTNGTSAGAGQLLGAPGPENLSSPIANWIAASNIGHTLIDGAVSHGASPNRVRGAVSDPPNNSTFGTLAFNRTFVNNTGAALTRLRFRVLKITTFPAPSGTADMRPRSSSSAMVMTSGGNVSVSGTTLEQVPNQPNGGGVNTTLSANDVTLGTPLANGASINLNFLFGLQQEGDYRIALLVEGLPGASNLWYLTGDTEFPAESTDSEFPPPNLSISDVTLAEGHSGTTAFTFNVTLDDPAPVGGVTFDIATADVTAQDGEAMEDNDYVAQSLTGQTILEGETGPFEFTVLVNGDTDIESNETFFADVTNIVGAVGVDTQGVGTIVNDDFSADLSITKSDGVTSAVPGADTVTYTITASNAGPDPVVGATVADTFPVSLINVAWTGVGAGGGTCTAAGAGNINDTVDLPVGASVTYTVTADVASSATGILANTATVTVPAGFTDPNTGNNSATDNDTLTPEADLSITVAIADPAVGPGDTVTYTIVASNAGPSDVVGATVADTFPTSLTGVTWTSTGAGGGTATPAGAGDINDMVNLPSGGSVTYTVTATVADNASGSLSNTATVTAPGGVTDGVPANDTDTDTVAELQLPPAPEGAAELTLGKAKHFGKVTVNRRSRLRQNISITNTGELTAEDLLVTLSGSGKDDFQVRQPLARVLAPGAATTFRATFRPRKAGTRRATATVTSTALPATTKLVGKGEELKRLSGPRGGSGILR